MGALCTDVKLQNNSYCSQQHKPTRVFMYSARYCCLILSKYGFPRQIFGTVPTVKFQDNPSTGSHSGAGGQMDGHKRRYLCECPPKPAPTEHTKKRYNRIIDKECCYFMPSNMKNLITCEILGFWRCGCGFRSCGSSGDVFQKNGNQTSKPR